LAGLGDRRSASPAAECRRAGVLTQVVRLSTGVLWQRHGWRSSVAGPVYLRRWCAGGLGVLKGSTRAAVECRNAGVLTPVVRPSTAGQRPVASRGAARRLAGSPRD
jgi:hypothetical protein